MPADGPSAGQFEAGAAEAIEELNSFVVAGELLGGGVSEESAADEAMTVAIQK